MTSHVTEGAGLFHHANLPNHRDPSQKALQGNLEECDRGMGVDGLTNIAAPIAAERPWAARTESIPCGPTVVGAELKTKKT